MANQLNKLTATRVKNATCEGSIRKLADGGGLTLVVKPNAKYWWLRYRFAGKEKSISIGCYPEVSLADAREGRDKARKLLRDGIDPSSHRQTQRLAREVSADNTFGAVTKEWFDQKHLQEVHTGYAHKNWRRLEMYAFPVIGRRPISDIKAPEVLEALRRIEKKGHHDNAHRVKTLIGQVFRYAVSTGRADSDVTRDLKGALTSPTKRHFPAVTTPEEIAPLLRTLEDYRGQPTTASALQLAPLLFTRPGNLRKMTWSQIDLSRGEWLVPSTKNGDDLLVPLPTQAMRILEELTPITGHFELVFPSVRSPTRPMSENTLNAALKSLGFGGQMTSHGFRAMARTVLVERLGYPESLLEMQLGHRVRDIHGRAYNRTQWLSERQKMMQHWADYLDELRQTG